MTQTNPPGRVLRMLRTSVPFPPTAKDEERLVSTEERLTAGTLTLDNVIDPSSPVQLLHLLIPLLHLAIVDTANRAQPFDFFKLLVAAGRRDDFGPRREGELSGKDRDAARPEDQDGLSREKNCSRVGKQRVPRGERCDGEGGGFDVSEIAGHGDETRLRNEGVC